jgi:ribosome recycling factor
MLDENGLRTKMDKSMAIFVTDIGSIRTGRATSGLIENVVVSVYEGQKMRLIELGSIGVPDARTLTFTPWDGALLNEIKNGIAAANLGMNPAVDGNLIRMSLPSLTVEQREDYVKLLGRKLEGVRGIIRDIRGNERRDLSEAKKEKEISENEFDNDEKSLQKITDEYMVKLEKLAESKEREIRGE